jgi:hypothetical protein
VSVVARRVAAVPARTATETWRAITALLAAGGDPGRGRLEAVTNVAAMLIAEEYTALAPIVVLPTAGDRIRIYTVHGEGAADAVQEEQPLASWPLQAPGWTISLPCGQDGLADTTAALRARPGFTARDLSTAADGAAETATGSARPAGRAVGGQGALVVDLEQLRRS